MPAREKTLDHKLARIRAGQYAPADFIIADAKDGDMGFGAGAPGPVYNENNQPTDSMRTMADYRAGMREMVSSGLVDIMLTSVSSAEALHASGTYSDTPVTPGVRVHDVTDIWNLIVGVLGGAAGTTRDTMELVAQAERCGARVALFGRKIWYAESPIEIVRLMRRVVERETSPNEAVRLYHDALAKAGIRARRPL